MNLSKGQQKALDDALSGKIIFITGAGGVGKSFLVHKIKEELEAQGKSVALTSSTGISAINIGGSTIHSFCGTGLRYKASQLKSVTKETETMIRRYNGHFDVIIIDEISMLYGDYIDMLDEWFKRIYRSQRPFGGRQIIYVGDFLQLPSVVTEDTNVENRFAFQSEAWNLYGTKEHFLNKVFRQDDKELQYYLACIRFGKINDEVLSYFNSRVGAKLDDPHPTILYPLKQDVSSVNYRKLDSLPGKEYEYDAKFAGDDKWQQALAKSVLAEVCLYVKEGSNVLFIRNNAEKGYYNGMKGIVKSCEEKTIIVETIDGEEIEVSKERWEKRDSKGKVVATMNQIPLILGDALSIHKAQGMSLEYMKCDLSRCFEDGQAYVALSRMKSINGLSLDKPIVRQNIRTNKRVVEYYRRLYKTHKQNMSIDKHE